MRVLLDTSFIVAFLFEGDVFHKDALRSVRHLSERARFYTIPLVVQETATVLCRRCREKGLDHSEAIGVFRRFLDVLRIVDVHYTPAEILEDMRSRECNLSFVDTVLLKASKRLCAKILTFDRRLLSYLSES